jgi:hypothetical protein
LQPFVVAQIKAGILGYQVLNSTSAGAWPGFLDSADPTAGKVYSVFYMYNARLYFFARTPLCFRFFAPRLPPHPHAPQITNPNEVLAGAKPNLTTIGPLNYLYRNTKHELQFDNDNAELVYKEYQRFEPVDAATVAFEKLPLTTVDVLFNAALRDPRFRDLMPLIRDDANAAFTTRTIHDILWGYTDASLLNLTFPGMQPNDTSLAAALAAHSHTRISTGWPNPATAWDYLEWEGSPALTCCDGGIAGETSVPRDASCAPAYATNDASAIRGIFGTMWHPFVGNDETTLTLATYPFSIPRHWPLVCGPGGGGPPLSLNDGTAFTSAIGGCDSYVTDGISLRRYTLPPWVMGNASVSPAEAVAFNNSGPSGLLDISRCQQKAPIFLSKPNFLHGSDSLADGVVGLPPATEARDGSWLGVEPLTGQVLDFNFQLAINAQLEPITVHTVGPFHLPFTYFPGVKKVYIPLGTGLQKSTISGVQADLFKSSVYAPVHAAVALRWVGVAAAALGAAAAAACVGAAWWSARSGAAAGAPPRDYVELAGSPALAASGVGGGRLRVEMGGGEYWENASLNGGT